ncbi:hypothetical protein DFP72DRAFT_840769 [Ephemerocybe angulata]|uniref:Uncharacterized protein n=1 Tax=Ephemerocybe angulata TaxID=980116 RepID=A0A8H6MBZ3_9AGAR|nr:hypothetical protein DFP72DRAFT_840769 [Tulosesus angulatus]
MQSRIDSDGGSIGRRRKERSVPVLASATGLLLHRRGAEPLKLEGSITPQSSGWHSRSAPQRSWYTDFHFGVPFALHKIDRDMRARASGPGNLKLDQVIQPFIENPGHRSEPGRFILGRIMKGLRKPLPEGERDINVQDPSRTYSLGFALVEGQRICRPNTVDAFELEASMLKCERGCAGLYFLENEGEFGTDWLFRGVESAYYTLLLTG